MKKSRLFMVFVFLIFAGCKTWSFDSVPYVISGDFVMEENALDYSICGIDIYLVNKSEKEIKNIKGINIFKNIYIY